MCALGRDTKQKMDGRRKIESKPIVESKPDAEVKTQSRKPRLLIAFLILVAVVLASLIFLYFKNSGMGMKSEANSTDKQEQVKAALGLDPFLVNLADENGARFLKATFQLGLAEKWEEDETGSVKVAAIRDSIISLLSSKTADQIMSSEGKDKLREEIRTRINSISPGTKVLEVYIVDFVVQL